MNSMECKHCGEALRPVATGDELAENDRELYPYVDEMGNPICIVLTHEPAGVTVTTPLGSPGVRLASGIDEQPMTAITARLRCNADAELIKRTAAATLRQMAEWLEEGEATAVLDVATAVEAFDDARDACCPCCQEVTCDGGCPLAPVRNHTEN